MKIIITRDGLRLSQRALFACSFLLLGYCGYTLIEGWTFQRRENRQLERLLTDKPHKPQLATVTAFVPVKTDGLLGRIDIPRLGVSAIVMEGTSAATLRHAAGHITGTSNPGESGNVGISAHRDTFFRPLRNIRRSDIITLTTPGGRFDYRVVSTRVVDPTETSVLKPGKGASESLTLVTCYPFYFVGPAPDRFIVLAERFI